MVLIEAGEPFLSTDTRDGYPYVHISQTAYEDNYSGFVAFLLKDARFTVNGQPVTPELGALSLVVTRGAVGLSPGLTTSLQLLTICTAFPGREPVEDLEVVFQLYLPDTTDKDVIGIGFATVPVGKVVETIVTDHRSGHPVAHRHTGAESPLFELSATP